jgi:hypothetical protein
MTQEEVIALPFQPFIIFKSHSAYLPISAERFTKRPKETILKKS